MTTVAGTIQAFLLSMLMLTAAVGTAVTASARTIAYICADGSLVVASFEPRTGRVLLTVGTWRVLLSAAIRLRHAVEFYDS